MRDIMATLGKFSTNVTNMVDESMNECMLPGSDSRSLCRGEVTETDGSRDLGREAYGRELYQDVKDLLGF